MLNCDVCLDTHICNIHILSIKNQTLNKVLK